MIAIFSCNQIAYLLEVNMVSCLIFRRGILEIRLEVLDPVLKATMLILSGFSLNKM